MAHSRRFGLLRGLRYRIGTSLHLSKGCYTACTWASHGHLLSSHSWVEHRRRACAPTCPLSKRIRVQTEQSRGRPFSGRTNGDGRAASWAEARVKIARVTLTIKLDGNWSSFQLANSAPPLSVTDSAIAPSARIKREGPPTFSPRAPNKCKPCF